MKFHKGHTAWNKGIPTKIKRCPDCGIFIGEGKEHICKSVDKKGIRYCQKCDRVLRNESWERYSKICGKCAKKIQRENERILRIKLIKQFGGKCQKCGYNYEIECLEFHHLFKEDKKGKHFLKQILKNPERFELLCNRCHREIEVKLRKEKNETYTGTKK